MTRGRQVRGRDVTALIARNDDEFAEAVGDAALIALLQSKPDGDEVPSSVWWLIAEALRTTVELRRCLAGHELKMAETLRYEAELLSEAALAELAAATGARPTPIAADATPQHRGLRPSFALQMSVLFLARMLVSQSATTPARLANTLAAHLRALDAVRQD
jgi:hypothetical protein